MGNNNEKSALESDFPGIAHELIMFWRKAEFEQYISDLIIQANGRAHEGFTDEIIEELRLLQDIDLMEEPPEMDIWGSGWGKHS